MLLFEETSVVLLFGHMLFATLFVEQQSTPALYSSWFAFLSSSFPLFLFSPAIKISISGCMPPFLRIRKLDISGLSCHIRKPVLPRQQNKAHVQTHNGTRIRQRRIHVSPEGFDLDTEQAPEVIARGRMEQPQPTWQHLVGKDGDEAKAEILRDFPEYTVSMLHLYVCLLCS